MSMMDCLSGYTGLRCDLGIDICGSTPCLNGGTCEVVTSGFRCYCVAGYSGRQCQLGGADACLSNPCLNNGTCLSLSNAFTCVCLPGFTGKCRPR